MKPITLLFFLLSLSLQAQFQTTGVVRNAGADKPLPFATISTNDGLLVFSDIDGKFQLNTSQNTREITISYIGFQSQTVPNDSSKKHFTVLLLPNVENLHEVAVGENPAVAIVRKAIQMKDRNNPEKKLRSFQFKAYNKLVITANPDSIKGTLDSVFTVKNEIRKFAKIDSADYKFKKLITKQHLYQTEKVSQFQFNEQGFKETILATRMAGFKQPIYEIIGLKLQSFSVYDNKYELMETSYDGPLANDALKEYNFTLLDTIAIGGRNTYMIFFKNKKRSKKEGLQGVLYIDQNNFGIAKSIFRIKGVIDVTGIHDYEYLPKQDLWFPTGKTFKIAKGNNEDNINLFVGQIQFQGDEDELGIGVTKRKSPKVSSDYVYLLSESNYFDTQFNVPFTIRKAAIAIQVKDDAINKNEAFWDTYRKDSLNRRSKQTYIALDSIVIKEGIEQKLKIGRRILNGYLPIGFFDLDLRYLVKYNNYEGFRFGLGGITNEKFSTKYRLEGYGAYALKDERWKYSLGGAARLGKFSNTWIGGSYTEDVREIGSTTFTIDKRVFRLYDPRPINVSTFYAYKTWSAYIETKIIPKTESKWELTRSDITPKFDYLYLLNDKLYDRFVMTAASVSIQWNPYSDYMQTPSGRIEIEKRFPRFTFQFTKSLPNVLGNDYDFGKIDLRADYEKKYLNGQKTSFLLQGGYAFGDIPITHLYSTSPNNLEKDGIIQRITIGGKNSFETMFFNEFFSSEYLFLQFKHAFKRVTLAKKIRPSLVLVSRAAWGDLNKQEQHIGLPYKTLNEGYFESGIELNQIYSGFGISGFLRYGPNQLPRFEDNISVKITYVFSLGF